MALKKVVPARGDIVWVDLSSTKGHEQAGRRPALVISDDAYNARSGMVLVCPLTTRSKNYPFEVAIKFENTSGVVLADQVQVIDWQARKLKVVGSANVDTVEMVVNKISALIRVSP